MTTPEPTPVPPEVPPVPAGGAVTDPERFAQVTAEQWAALRAPFLDAQIGKLPRVWCSACREAPRNASCSNHKMDTCRVCRNRITSAHLHLDYVGHAAVTNRLLEVDPVWNWRPATKEELESLPPIDRAKEMWLALTVLGVTRWGIGDGSGRGGTDGTKIMIGDALRNAAMRFGVALDLWSKEDLSAKAEAEAEAKDEVQRGLAGEEETHLPSTDWLKKIAECKDLGNLIAMANQCNEAGDFTGATRAAFATKRKDLEKKAERDAPTDPPANE